MQNRSKTAGFSITIIKNPIFIIIDSCVCFHFSGRRFLGRIFRTCKKRITHLPASDFLLKDLQGKYRGTTALCSEAVLYAGQKLYTIVRYISQQLFVLVCALIL